MSPPATQLRLAAVGRDAVDVDVAAVLDREHDRAAVPDRLADLRVGIAGAVERGGQDAEVLARRVHHPDLRVAREVEAARIPLDGELLPVRRVARRVVVGVVRRQPLRLAALGRHDVDVALELDVPVLVPRRRERDALAVGRPRRARVLEVAVGDLLRLGRAVGGDDVEVPPAVARPADRVELVEQPREAARGALLVVLLLVRLVGHARREDDPASRPATRPPRRRRPSARSGTGPRRRPSASRRAAGAPSRRRAWRRRRAARRRATSAAARRSCRSSAGAAAPSRPSARARSTGGTRSRRRRSTRRRTRPRRGSGAAGGR